MKWIEILRKDNYALLQSESDTQYVVASGYNPDAEEDQLWSNGTYFTYWESAECKAECLQAALDCLRSRTEERYVTKKQKYLEIYREDYGEGTFDEILQSLDLDDDMVGDSFGCYCIVDEESLKRQVLTMFYVIWTYNGCVVSKCKSLAEAKHSMNHHVMIDKATGIGTTGCYRIVRKGR